MNLNSRLNEQQPEWYRCHLISISWSSGSRDIEPLCACWQNCILIQRIEEGKDIRMFCLTSVWSGTLRMIVGRVRVRVKLCTCVNMLLFFAVISSSAQIYNISSLCMFHLCHIFSTEKLKWAQNQIQPHWGGSSCPKWIPGFRPDLCYRRPGVKSCALKSVNRRTHCIRVWTSSQLQQCTKIWPGTGSKHQQEAYLPCRVWCHWNTSQSCCRNLESKLRTEETPQLRFSTGSISLIRTVSLLIDQLQVWDLLIQMYIYTVCQCEEHEVFINVCQVGDITARNRKQIGDICLACGELLAAGWSKFWKGFDDEHNSCRWSRRRIWVHCSFTT